jgi:hypothetical protein
MSQIPAAALEEYYELGISRPWNQAAACVVVAIFLFVAAPSGWNAISIILYAIIGVISIGAMWCVWRGIKKRRRMTELSVQYPDIIMAYKLRRGEDAYERKADLAKLFMSKEEYSKMHAGWSAMRQD